MLRGAVLNSALAFGGKCVMRLKVVPNAGKRLALHRLAVLLVTIGAAASQPKIRAELSPAFVKQFRRQRLLAAKHKDIFPVPGVINGHVPVNRIPCADGGTAEGSEVGHHEI